MSPERACLLVVDDEAPVRDAVRALVARRLPEVDVVLACDAKAALEVLARRHVDILVTDHRMPGMTGVELAAYVARHSPSTRRILMTAYGDLPLATRAINEGHVARLLAKPVRSNDLVHALAEILEARRRERESVLALANGIETLRQTSALGAP